MPDLTQGFPQITAPLVDPQGRITAPWMRLLNSLWARTGSAQGASSSETQGLAADALLLAAFDDEAPASEAIPDTGSETAIDLEQMLFQAAMLSDADEYRSKVKVGALTRDTALASASQTVTGAGFRPKALAFLALVNGTTNASWGFDDGLSPVGFCVQPTAVYAFNTGFSVIIFQSSTDRYRAAVSSLDPDGFTIAWTRTGSPTGTATVYYLAIG